MTERLAIPAWSAPPCPLEAWVAAFAAHGHEATIAGLTPDEAELAVETLGLRAYVGVEGGRTTALDFDVDARVEATALRILGEVAAELGWELHEEDEGDE